MTESKKNSLSPLLEGVTVLDLSLLLPGPMAAWHLAELGARVVKVEPPQGDDAARMQKLLDMIEELDDMQDVYHNAAL